MGKCEICGSTKKTIKHHVSYNPEITQILCYSCHKKGHNSIGTLHELNGFKHHQNTGGITSVSISMDARDALKALGKKDDNYDTAIRRLLKMPPLKMKRKGAGRKSLAEKLYDQAKEEYEEEKGMWFVMYDFKGKASSKFWDNLNRVMGMGDGGSRIQYSVFATTSVISAITIARIVKHYGGNAIMHNAAEPFLTIGEDGLFHEMELGVPGKVLVSSAEPETILEMNRIILKRKGYEID